MTNVRRSNDVSALVRDIYPSFAELNRQPFQEVLALVMAARPTPENLVSFARDYPDRWANMCAIFARLAGYSEKMDISQNHNFTMTIQNASDADLHQMLADLRANPDKPSPLDGVIQQIAADRASLLPPPTPPTSNLETQPIPAAKPRPAAKKLKIKVKKRG